MGGSTSIAETVTESTIQSTVDIVTKYMSTSKTATGCNNSISFRGCNVTRSNFDQSCMLTVTSTSISEFKNDSVAQQKAIQEAVNTIKQKSDGGSFGKLTTEASKTITKHTQILATKIVNEIKQSCEMYATLKNQVTCDKSKLDLINISQKSLGNFVFKCINNSDIVNKAKNDMVDAVSNDVEQTVTDSTTIWIIIIAVVAVLVIGIVIYIRTRR